MTDLNHDRAPTPELLSEQAPELSINGCGLALLLQEVIGHGKSLRFCARGPSMSPFIQDGDLVTVSPLKANPAARSLALGDVAALIHPVSGKLLLHRVVGRRKQQVMIKADRVAHEDGLFGLQDIVGRVARVERHGRAVRVGLGPERGWIARLSRYGLLMPAVRALSVLNDGWTRIDAGPGAV